MSMNLNARVKRIKLDLWQTPTQISYTILPSHISTVKGAKAKEAMLRYMEWVRYSTNGIWNSVDDLNLAHERVKDHLTYIEQFLDDKNLEVWVM